MERQPIFRIGRFNMTEMSVLHKLIYRLNTISIKISAFSAEIEKMIVNSKCDKARTQTQF